MYFRKHDSLKSWFLASTLLLTGQTTLANPKQIPVVFTCPCANSLKNEAGGIFGMGTELIYNLFNPIRFESRENLSQIPSDFANYIISSIDYQGALGLVSCRYISINETEPSIELAYEITNGKGGLIQAQSYNTMIIYLPLGVNSL